MKISTLLAISSLVFFCIVSIGYVNAMETGFITNSLNQQKQDKIWNNLQFTISDTNDTTAGICSFAVNEHGQIALGFSDHSINIYSHDCQHLYSLVFQSLGDFYLEWDEQNLLIYLVRSGTALSVDRQGSLIEMREIDSARNNDYWISLKDTSRIINGTKYEIKNEHGLINFLATSYSKLVKVDANGSESVIYDNSKSHRASIFAATVGILIFAAIVVTGVARYWFSRIK